MTAEQEFHKQAQKNLDKWGPQDYRTLALAVAEEAGELAQAVLKHDNPDGFKLRIREEAVDLGALCVQIVNRYDLRDSQ